MRILITGGLGYIGGRIADYLKQKEFATDIFLTTRGKNRSFAPWTEIFKILEMDVLDEASIEKCINYSHPDIIIHLVALNEIDSMQNPELADEINSKGTYRLLESAYRMGVKKFIYFSTFHVYGKYNNSIVTEQTPAHPTHPYAITHLAAERVVDSFRDKGMKTLIFRLSNAYGYPMDIDINRWMLVVNDLCRQAVVNQRIVLKSSGRQHRDFITLADVARAVYHFIFVIPDKWEDGLYNLGSGKSMSILEMAQNIADIYRKIYKKEEVRIERKIENDNNPNTVPFAYSIDKIKNRGFQLEGNMETEIARTMSVCEGFLDAPLVSAIMPTYNQTHFIGEAIDSVLHQTHYNIELIIIDNYSTDNTEQAVNSFADPRIKYYKFANHGIIAASRNFGIKNSCGKYIAFIDSDDVWYPNKLENQLNYLRKNPSISLVGCSLRIKSPDINDNKIMNAHCKIYSGYLYDRLLNFNFMASSSVIIRGSILNDIGYFDESKEIVSVEDWDLWLRIARKYKIALIPDVLGIYRMHGSSQSDSSRFQKVEYTLDKHLRNGWITQKEADNSKANFYLHEGWFYITKDIKFSRPLFLKGLHSGKGNLKICFLCIMGSILSKLPFLAKFIKGTITYLSKKGRR